MITNSPYVGSRPFDTADAAIFHGRAEEAAALSELWRHHRLTVLHGPAGVGKSSLLQAGVLPEISAGPAAQVLPVGRLAFHAGFPLAALPDLNPFTFTLMTSWYPDKSPIRISGSSIRSLVRRNSRTDRHGGHLPVFASVDQTDLLFPGVRKRDGQRRRFVDELADAVKTQDAPHPRLHLLISVRTDNLDELLGLLSQAGFPAESIAEYPLRGFAPAAACQTVGGPLSDLDHPLATAAEQLVEELGVGGADIDPALLQIVCEDLRKEFSPGGGTRPEHLRTVVDRVLGDHCLRALATVAVEHGHDPGNLAHWFRRTFGRRTSSGGVAEGRELTRDVPNAIVGALVDARLLRVDQHADKRRYHLRQARLHPVVRRLNPEAVVAALAEKPRLEAAEAAFTAGELETASRHAEALAGATTTDGRLRAAAECLLGTIAYDQDRVQPAIKHYEAATSMFDTLGETGRVGMLHAAIGQLKIDDSAAEAVNRLQTALRRVPGDLFVKTALAKALWYAGRIHAAIAILDDVLSQEGGTPEALRLRGELLADLNKAEPALRDLDRINYGDQPSSRAARALAKKTCEGVGPAATEEMALVNDAADSGPVLLRLARLVRLEGDADTAAGLAERAVRAQRPSLPQHMRKEAERLMLRQAF